MGAALTFPVTAALGLLLLGGVQREQLVAAAVFGAAAVSWSMLVRRVGERPIRFSPRHLAPWFRAIASLPGDTLGVGAVLVRAALSGGSPGRAQEVSFRGGAVDDSRDRGRRATAVLTGSLSPDTIVVDAPPGRAVTLVHTMTGGECDGSDGDWLA